MGWTMTLKDGSGTTAWTQRARNYLSLHLFLFIFFISVQSDAVLPKDHHFSWRAGQWTQCIGEECGSGGVQKRPIWCVHAEGWTAHHSHCQHIDRPESQRHCFKVCDWHQDLFEWDLSDWGSCVLIPVFFNKLEVKTAECITAQHGIQRRKVHCVRTSNRTAVPARICEFFSPKPAVDQACLIPCPQDCVVSDFASWSGCSRTCGAGLQHRTRHVLATPMYGGATCPNLTETRTCSSPFSCPAGKSEYQYSLKVGAWSECQIHHRKDALLSGRTKVDFSTSTNENNTVTLHSQHNTYQHNDHRSSHKYPMSWALEVGFKTRQVHCTRSDGQNSLLSHCTKENSPLTFQACLMPKDCQTSTWSLWSSCSKTCRSTDLSPGYRLRTRSITYIPVGGGKQCPTLEEKEACNIIGDLLQNCPSFEWRTTDWGKCRILPLLSTQDRRLGNITILCGGGIQTRSTYCAQVPDDSAPHHRKEGLLLKAAEMKEDTGILSHIKDKDCVAMEVRYHKSCYRQYTRFLTKSTATVTGITEEETKEPVFDVSYKIFCEQIIRQRIIVNQEVLRMNQLRRKFINIVKEHEDIDASSYRMDSLKRGLTLDFPQLVFHSPSKRNICELVFVETLAAE